MIQQNGIHIASSCITIRDPILTRATPEKIRIIAGSTLKVIIVGAAIQGIIPSVATKPIITCPTVQIVVSGPAAEGIITAYPVKGICVVCSLQLVIARIAHFGVRPQDG